jgi:hypothetical protein
MEVEAVFKDTAEREGSILDIWYFRLAEERQIVGGIKSHQG